MGRSLLGGGLMPEIFQGIPPFQAVADLGADSCLILALIPFGFIFFECRIWFAFFSGIAPFQAVAALGGQDFLSFSWGAVVWIFLRGEVVLEMFYKRFPLSRR